MKNYVVLLVVFFSWFGVAHALEIKEVMYNPTVKTDHLWVKVCNNDSTGITLTNWFILDQDIVTLSWHYRKINTNGSTVLVPGLCAIVAKATSNSIGDFKTKNPEISGFPLFYGNLTIGNKGTLGLSKDGKTIVEGSEMFYGGTNTSLNNNLSDNSSENNTVDETIDPIPLIEEDPLVFKITTKIISPKIVVAGIPFSLSSLTTTNTGKTYNFGKFIWNFGDGMQVGVKESKPFDYIYEYPGEYILSISYFDNSFVLIPDATDRIIIKVIPSDVYISSVGTDSDPYIELENKSNYEVTLSGWIIKGGDKTFIFPEGTTLLQGKKIKLSPKITGFTFDDIKYITILNPSNEVVATYPEEKKKIVQAYGVNNSNYNNSVPPKNVLENNPSVKDPQIINLNDLGASASDVKVGIPSLTYSIIGLIIIIGLGITSFLFIKKKKEIPDYVERGVSAKDMTIIE